jgi:hypothetical protein
MMTGNPTVDFFVFVGGIILLNVYMFEDSDIFKNPFSGDED